jgi:hypothetical protein
MKYSLISKLQSIKTSKLQNFVMLFPYSDVPQEYKNNFEDRDGTAYWKFPPIQDTFDFLVDAIKTETFDNAMENYGDYPVRLGLYIDHWSESSDFKYYLLARGYMIDEGGNVQLPFFEYEDSYNQCNNLHLKDRMYFEGDSYKKIYDYMLLKTENKS